MPIKPNQQWTDGWPLILYTPAGSYMGMGEDAGCFKMISGFGNL